MKSLPNLISVLALRKLLFDLRDKHATTCIRFRISGEMWKRNFMRIVEITEKGAVFNDESIGEFVYVKSLSDVMQFELDGRFQTYQPHIHYEVLPSPD